MGDQRPVIGHVLHRLQLAGAEVLAAALSRELSDRYRFLFLCLDGIGPLGQRLMGEGFKVVDLKRRPGVDLRVARRLRREVQRYGIDLLHAHQYTPFFYAATSRDWGVGDRPPILFTEHGRHYPDARRVRRVLANRVLLKPGDRVTAVGRFIREALIDHEGIAGQRIEVVYNGIDPEAFTTRPVLADEASPSAEPPIDRREGELIVLQVARFHAVKDHATAIRAFARVAESLPQARLVLVGDGDLRGTIEEMVGQRGLTGRVTFLGVREDVASLLPLGDVFLLSSLSEGISVTLLEAMAAKLPIVATQVGGNPEVVDHGRNGLLSPRGDDVALANNLLMVLRDPVMRARLGEAGRNRLLKLFTQKQMHQAYARIYAQMLGDTGA